MFPPTVRKIVLTVHVATAVGWLGAVAAYLALDVAATVSTDVDLVRAAYAAMEIVTSAAIIPLAIASLVVGTVNALGTPWGLLRHYWVVTKLLLTAIATVVLLVESRTISELADAASEAADPRHLPGTLPHSVGGLVILLAITILSTVKPRGLTRYGWRRQQRLVRSTGQPIRR